MSEESKDTAEITAIKRHYGSICWAFFQEISESSKEQIKLEVVRGKTRVCVEDEQTKEMTDWLRRLRESINYSNLNDSWSKDLGIFSAILTFELAFYRLAARMFLDEWASEPMEPHTDEWEVLVNMVKPWVIFSKIMDRARDDGLR